MTEVSTPAAIPKEGFRRNFRRLASDIAARLPDRGDRALAGGGNFLVDDAVLLQAMALRDRSNLVFPSMTGRPLPDSTISKLVRENGITAVPHGFRSSFRDWCGECSGAPREVAEAALAHAVGGVEGACARSDLFERRRTLMQAWSNYLGYSRTKMDASRSSRSQ